MSHRLSGSDCSATLSDNTVWQLCLAVQHFRAVQHCPPTLSGYYVWQCNTAVHCSQLSSVHCNELHCIALCCNRDFLISLEAFNPQQLQSIFCHFATERFCSVNINWILNLWFAHTWVFWIWLLQYYVRNKATDGLCIPSKSQTFTELSDENFHSLNDSNKSPLFPSRYQVLIVLQNHTNITIIVK